MFSTYCRNTVVPLLLRVALAVVFVFHGMDLVGGETNEWGAGWNHRGHPPLPALGLGFLTRVAAVGIIVMMVGAIATVHWPHGFDSQKGGFEYNFVLIITSLCLVLTGPGSLSVDRFFRSPAARRQPDPAHSPGVVS
jgi:uncharacterized membrane protein YphA (DoxX/SURF4 family)